MQPIWFVWMQSILALEIHNMWMLQAVDLPIRMPLLEELSCYPHCIDKSLYWNEWNQTYTTPIVNWTRLHTAAYDDILWFDFEFITHAKLMGVDALNTKDSVGHSPMWIAASKCNYHSIAHLHNLGVSFDNQMNLQNKSLKQAVWMSYKERPDECLLTLIYLFAYHPHLKEDITFGQDLLKYAEENPSQRTWLVKVIRLLYLNNLFQFHIEFLDLEATSKDPKEDEITQIGSASGLLTQTNVIRLPTFSEMVKCSKPIDPKSSEITGITNDMLKNCDPLPDVLGRFSEYLQSLPKEKERILIAYNGKKFDLPLLIYEIRRHHLNPLEIIRSWRITWFLDPLVLAKNVLDTTKLKLNDRGLPCYKLESVYQCLFGTSLKNAHNALFDATGLLQLITDVPSMKESFLTDVSASNPKYAENVLTFIQSLPTNIHACNKRKSQTFYTPPALYKRPKFDIEILLGKTEFDNIQTGIKTTHILSTNRNIRVGSIVQFRCEKDIISKTILTSEALFISF